MLYMFKNNITWFVLAILCISTAYLSAKPKLKQGDSAPAFTMKGDDNKTYSLSDLSKQKVVLYFYPFDDSHYCTKQACSLAKGYERLKQNKILLFGVNHQSVKSHATFKKKYKLPFILLSDPSRAAIKAYGAHSTLFTKRITALIDKGKIVTILHDIDLKNHANQIIEAFSK